MSKKAWCKNCRRKIVHLPFSGWFHPYSQNINCYQPPKVVAEPDRDRSIDDET